MKESNKNNRVKKSAGIIAAVLIAAGLLMFVLNRFAASQDTIDMITKFIVLVCFIVSCILFILRVKRERTVRKADVINILLIMILLYVLFR